MNFTGFLQHFTDTALEPWLQQLPTQIEQGLSPQRFGDLPRWQAALAQLPQATAQRIVLDADTVTVSGAIDDAQRQQLQEALMGLHPWRKGPFELFGIHIDTEWRSDWKWQRLAPHIQPLTGRTVLDVGCGSGYHCWRMRGAGASLVIGIEPGPLFVHQFQVLQHYINDHHVGVLPLHIEQLPDKLRCFDTVFSMGILYHRRSPLDHLLQLREALREGGELVLETLVVDGPEGYSLLPTDRYARMGNVWFLPSTATLESWLAKTGFRDIRVVDVNTTSIEEQRRTEWMRFHSLADFLDPADASRTLEGYPAPCRAIVVAKAP